MAAQKMMVSNAVNAVNAAPLKAAARPSAVASVAKPVVAGAVSVGLLIGYVWALKVMADSVVKGAQRK